jgi:hypothetical protein
MDKETVTAAPMADGVAELDSGCTPVITASPVARGAWTRDIEALCRALDAQQRAHFPSTDDANK